MKSGNEPYDSSWDENNEEPFGIGHIMDVLAIVEEDDKYGIIIKVREDRKDGYIPLRDVEVTTKDDPNFWPVRESLERIRRTYIFRGQAGIIE